MPSKKTSAPKPAATATKAKTAATANKAKSAGKKMPNFLGLPDKNSSAGNSKVFIVPVPYEATTCYGKGTKNGPKAILEASTELERFDDELWAEPHKIGIHTTEAVSVPKVIRTTEKPFQKITDAIKPYIETDKFPIILGGEHSLTLGAVRACAERYKDLSILQVDAHADLRPEYQDNPYSHASVSYQLYKCLPQPLITQVGIRNISREETEWLEKEHPRVNIFWARQQHKWNFQEIVDTLSDNVYLTVDVDGLDPSIMPATGTPEPGGMSWNQLMELIKLVCVKKNVVAADFVELSPIKGMHAPDFLVAKDVFKLIGYRYALDLGVTKRY